MNTINLYLISKWLHAASRLGDPKVHKRVERVDAARAQGEGQHIGLDAVDRHAILAGKVSLWRQP